MSACYSDFRGLSASQLIAMTLRDNDAASILNSFPNLRAIEEASVEDMETAGLSQEQAATLKAAIELGRRCLTEPKSKTYIQSARDIYDLLGHEMGRLDREQIRVVTLDIRNGVIDIEIVAIGTLNSCMVIPGRYSRMPSSRVQPRSSSCTTTLAETRLQAPKTLHSRSA